MLHSRFAQKKLRISTESESNSNCSIAKTICHERMKTARINLSHNLPYAKTTRQLQKSFKVIAYYKDARRHLKLLWCTSKAAHMYVCRCTGNFIFHFAAIPRWWRNISHYVTHNRMFYGIVHSVI